MDSFEVERRLDSIRYHVDDIEVRTRSAVAEVWEAIEELRSLLRSLEEKVGDVDNTLTEHHDRMLLLDQRAVRWDRVADRWSSS